MYKKRKIKRLEANGNLLLEIIILSSWLLFRFRFSTVSVSGIYKDFISHGLSSLLFPSTQTTALSRTVQLALAEKMLILNVLIGESAPRLIFCKIGINTLPQAYVVA